MLGTSSIITQVVWSTQNPLFPKNVKVKNDRFYYSFSKFKAKIKKISLNQNQIANVSNQYSRTFDLREHNLKFKSLLEKHGNNHFIIYTRICYLISGIKLIEMKNNRFICEIPSKKERTQLEENNKHLFMKAINKRKLSEPLNSIYDDEIMFKIIVYK